MAVEIMTRKDSVTYQFHHLGIPTTEVRDGERYSERFRMYTSETSCELARVQYHRFEPGSPLHPLIQSTPHLAFKVNDLDRAVVDCEIILGPYEPIPGFRVAMVIDGGQPVEFVETDLSDDELWARAETGTNLLYATESTASAQSSA